MSQLTTLADGRYRLSKVLGSGAMGVVYQGWDTNAHKWRAIKVLSPLLARNKMIRERFRREARALNQLAHPNIVRIHDFQDTARSGEQQRFLVMDLIPGGSSVARLVPALARADLSLSSEQHPDPLPPDEETSTILID